MAWPHQTSEILQTSLTCLQVVSMLTISEEVEMNHLDPQLLTPPNCVNGSRFLSLDLQETRQNPAGVTGIPDTNIVLPTARTLSPETFAKVSGVAAAVVYATGFLIDFTHSQRLGIGDGVGDLFKAKHMLVGTIYWLLLILIGIPTFAFTNMYVRNKEVNLKRAQGEKEPLLISLSGLLISLQLLGLLYLVTLVAPPRFLSRQAFWVGLNFFFSVPILGRIYALIRGLRDPETYKKRNKFWRTACYLSSRSWCLRPQVSYSAPGSWKTVRIMLLVLTLAIDWRCLAAERLMPVVLAMFWNAKILIGILVFMASVIFQYRDRSSRAKTSADKRSLWQLCGAKLVIAFVFSVIGFAYSVYPFIPSERGGGNYMHAPDVVLWVKNETADIPDALIEEYRAGVKITKPVKLVEQTTAWLYIASPPGAQYPAEWRPDITCVRKDLVTSMKFVAVE